jgi:hypothetical protein
LKTFLRPYGDGAEFDSDGKHMLQALLFGRFKLQPSWVTLFCHTP